MPQQLQNVSHGFGPFWEPDSEILILGSFPSVKSREQAFYYGHPQNRFWRVLAQIYGEPAPQSLPEKKELLRRHKIALWDVIERCDIRGSSDASIKNPLPADLFGIAEKCPLRRVVLNGKTAERLFLKFFEDFPVKAAAAPSTSPANAQVGFEELVIKWKNVLTAPLPCDIIR